MFQMEYVQIAQDNYFAKQTARRKARKAEQKRIIRKTIILAITVVTLIGTTAFAKANVKSTEQKYIVRYGRAWNWGNQVQLEDDRSVWNVIDPPEFAEGTDVRVVFATNGTLTTDDDTVVDVTERY